MAVRVWGWEKAKAVLSWDGYGLEHHPARKRADFPAVSRHENAGRIDTEGVANVPVQPVKTGITPPLAIPFREQAGEKGPIRRAGRLHERQ